MKLPTRLRNVLIIVALAVIVGGLKAGSAGASVIATAVSLGFFGAFAWAGAVYYREHRMTLMGLGDHRRVLLYAAAGALVLMLSGTGRLWGTSFGSIVWLVVVACAVYAMVAVYRSSKQY